MSDRALRAVAASRIVAAAIAILLPCSGSGCAPLPSRKPAKMGPVDTGPGTLAAAGKYLEGRWSLISYEVFPPGRPAIRVAGSGTITYDSFGNLDMQIRVSDPAVAEALERAGIPLENGVIATSGRTAIDLRARTLTYILEGQKPLVPSVHAGPLALTRPRYWSVEGNVLTLTTKGDDGQPLSVGRWEKQQ